MHAITALLNLFAATGHIHYAKSARLCVQEMRKFVEGYHTVRRSERQWAGLWTDILIEHVDEVSEKRWWSYKMQRHD